MTMHQLYYTSCEDGVEGIQGFQISAMTPGAPKPLVELAVRASAYEAGPGLVAQDGGTDLSAFPVAFGYVPSGPAATLFQSRYTGSDFTGRTGNYFAHALLLDDADRELRGALPIDMWRSPTWVHTRPGSTSLPVLDTIAPGGTTSPAKVREFLSAPGRISSLALMVSAVQRVLSEGRGRIVIVVHDDQTAAVWLAALCRSFPRALGLGISFLTYTSRPEDAGVLVSCTTPDVHLPTYGDFTVVDVTTDAPDGEPARYAALLARLWAAGDVSSALLPANRVSPPLAPGELDAFAVLVECADGGSVARVTEPLVLDAVELAVHRAPGVLGDRGWEQLAGLLRDAGGPGDLPRWSAVVQEALRRREPVPPDLLSTYCVAALGAPERLWLPPLHASQLEHLAEHSVLPAITGAEATTLLDRLAEHPGLGDATARALERRLSDPDDLVRLVTTLAPQAATLLRHHLAGGRVAALTELVLARAGQEDRVAVLSRVVERAELDWSRLGAVLWPDEPSVPEAVRALRTLRVDVLVHTRLLDRIAALVVRQVGRGELGPDRTRLVSALLEPTFAAQLPPADVAVLKALQLSDHFRQATPKHEAFRMVQDSLQLCRSVPPEIGDQLFGSLAEFILRADAAQHLELVNMSLGAGGKRFLTPYREKAEVKLAKASPSHAAPTIVVWCGVSDARTRQQLVNETLVTALKRRKAKHLDKIGELLKPTASKLAVKVTPPGDNNWAKWWRTWRSAHQRRGLLAMLGLRKEH